MTRRFLPLLMVLLTLSACGGANERPDGKDERPRTDASAKARLSDWMDKLCVADDPLMSLMSDATSTFPAPQIPKAATAADRRELSTYTRAVLDRIGLAKKKLSALPPAPTTASKRLLADYRADVGSLHSSFFKYAEHTWLLPPERLHAVANLAAADLNTFEGIPFKDHPEVGQGWCRSADGPSVS